MWSFTQPTVEQIKTFLREQEKLPYSYGETGQSNGGAPHGFDLDHNRAELGHGEEDYAAALAALRSWKMFPQPWTLIWPAEAPQHTTQVVAMLARVYGLWWLNACRIVYTIDENAPVRRCGFAYGTLPGHVEMGEERFLVEMLADGSVWYDVRAFSRPRHPLVKLAKPLARQLQRRFVRESKLAMQRAVAEARAK